MRKIAFVGAEESKLLSAGLDLESVEMHLRNIIQSEKNEGEFIFISGACPKGGVDIIAENVADELGLQKLIFAPDVHQWTGTGIKMGYKERDIAMAASCDILYCVDPVGVKSGGDWTLRMARRLGKEVHRVELSPSGIEHWS